MTKELTHYEIYEWDQRMNDIEGNNHLNHLQIKIQLTKRRQKSIEMNQVVQGIKCIIF